MKTVVNSAQVAHLFANRVQSEARNGQGNFRFGLETVYRPSGPNCRFYVLYSYGTPIAFQAETATGSDTLFITEERYSVTTSGQLSDLRGAASHRNKLTIPGAGRGASDWINRTLFNVEKLVETFREELVRLQEAAFRSPRKTTIAAKLAARFETAQNVLRSIYGERGVKLLKFTPSEVTKDAAEKFKVAEAKRNKREFAKQEKARKAQQAQFQKELDAALPLWRAGELRYLPHVKSGAPAFVRLSKDGEEVETSNGARVPLALALAFYRRLVKNEVALGQHVGHFTVGKLDVENVTIGCTTILRSELDALAFNLCEQGNKVALEALAEVKLPGWPSL